MGAFQKISLHSVYSNYVKEIVFDGSEYEAGPAQTERVYQRAQESFVDLQVGSYWTTRTR